MVRGGQQPASRGLLPSRPLRTPGFISNRPFCEGINLERGPIARAEAIAALERSAVGIFDDTLPAEIRYETFKALVKGATGKSPGSFKSNTMVPIKDAPAKKPVHQVSIIRGVVLNLYKDMVLVSISVTPRKLRERRKILSIVGIGRDVADDVALRHDDYLAEEDPHGSS